MGHPRYLIAIDTETTGFRAGLHDPRAQDAIQVGGVTVDLESGEEVASYESLIRPHRPQNASERAMEIHGIPMERLLEAPYPHQVIPEMEAALVSPEFAADRDVRLGSEYLVLGQYLHFDLSHLAPVYERAGRELIRLGRNHQDTKHVARWLLDHGLLETRDASTSLDPVLEALGLERESEAHGALEDARLTVRAYLEFRRIQRQVNELAAVGVRHLIEREPDTLEGFDRGLLRRLARRDAPHGLADRTASRLETALEAQAEPRRGRGGR